MKKPRPPVTTVRKAPRQARSSQLVQDILQAAARVLIRDGARRFTTARVAERAGVSVGSLYQYFPNKESILFRLQTDEWQQTSTVLLGILEDETRAPMVRLRAMVHAFFESECEEAELRVALSDAAPLYRDTPEAHVHTRRSSSTVRSFLREVLPHASARKRDLAAQVVMTSMSTLGKKISEQPHQRARVKAWADEAADMYAAYLAQL